jgi:hypothetical protein
MWTYAPRQEFTHLGTSCRFSCCHYDWNGLLYFHEAFFSVKVLLKFLEWFLICVCTDKWTVGVTQGSESVWIWSYCYSSLSAIRIGFDQTDNLFACVGLTTFCATCLYDLTTSWPYIGSDDWGIMLLLKYHLVSTNERSVTSHEITDWTWSMPY